MKKVKRDYKEIRESNRRSTKRRQNDTDQNREKTRDDECTAGRRVPDHARRRERECYLGDVGAEVTEEETYGEKRRGNSGTEKA